MASPVPGHLNAYQIGSYFVSNYYQILENQPQLGYQFYSNLSTVVRLDSATMESATAAGLLQIHNVLMSFNLNAIEIKSTNFLDSWSGGIFAMVSGLVLLKNYTVRRKFVQTFFLAPQEKGYFVLNDIFQVFDNEHQYHHPAAYYMHTGLETKMNPPNSTSEAASNYVAREDVQAKELMALAHAEESDAVENWSLEVQQQLLESETRLDETPIEESPPPFSGSAVNIQDIPVATPAPSIPPVPHVVEEEPVGEPPKQTYASVLRTKGQSGHIVPQPTSLNKATVGTPESQQPAQSTQQNLQPSLLSEKFNLDTYQEASIPEEEGDFFSVYVGNLSPSTSVFDLEKEFKAFGRIRPDGVAIRSKKEAGVFFGFVEFEDFSGVHNALKASPIELNGRLIHVEERRPNSWFSRGGRRGRGRGSYPSDTSRGRFSDRSHGRGSGQDHDRDYISRSRGDGYQKRGGATRDGNYTSEDY